MASLTQIGIEKMRAPAMRKELPDGKGLYLIVQPSGAKAWALRYRTTERKTVKLTLGPFRALRKGEPEPATVVPIGEPLTIGQARALAANVRLGIAVKEDPATERRKARKADADAGDRDHFEVVARRFLEQHARPNTRSSTFKETVNVLGFRAMPDGKLGLRSNAEPRPLDTWPVIRWRGRKVQTIQRRDVNELLEAIKTAGAPHAANSTLSAVRRLFNWCVEQDVRSTSPCAGIRKPVATGQRERVLSDAELRLILRAATRLGYPFGHLTRLLCLTACRRDEWARASAPEIDLERLVFSLPGRRSKNGVGLELPLSPQAVRVIEEVNEHRPTGEPAWLFSTGRGRSAAMATASLRPISGFSKAKTALDREMLALARRDAEEAGEDPDAVKPIPEWRLHDLRRTTVTGLARLGVALPVSTTGAA